MIEQAKKLCMLGATDSEIADFFEVDVRTIYRWKNENDEFCQALTVGKQAADARVVRSLYQRAVGYYVKEEQALKIKKDQFEEEVEIVEVEKYVAPTDTSIVFWLKNRQPEAWRDKQQHELTGKDGGPVQVESTLFERLEARRRSVFDDDAEGSGE